jgi:sugar lactone lactonase YvrE
MALAREATQAAERGDTALYLERMTDAAALRGDFPRILVNLAAAQLANGREEECLATLRRLAALGVNSPVEKSPEFAALVGRKDFQEVARALTANLQAKGEGRITFSLRDFTGLAEGIAWRTKTGDFFFGDVNGRAVWVRGSSGELRRFTPEGDGLWGVFGLLVDEEAGVLWAATAAVPAMRGFAPEQDGTAGIAEIALADGTVRRVIPVERASGDRYSHVLGDLARAADDTLYLPDSGAPVIWRLRPGAEKLEPWLEHPEFPSLQGIVVRGGVLIVADHAAGLLRIDLETRGVQRLLPPENATLVGLDGLVLAPDGTILAIQNGLRPTRVLRISLDDVAETVTEVRVLESGHLTMAAPSLGCIGPEGALHFIGNAGWTRFEGTDGRPSQPRSIPIFRTELPRAR